MRIFLLPISTRQSLLYCHRINQQLPTATPGWGDRIINKASTTWLSWEKKKSGWQGKVTEYGNKLFQRLPYEEWGLKSIPALSAQREVEETAHRELVEVQYPPGLLQPSRVLEILKRLGGDEKQAFHLKWCLGSIVGMPISAPVMLIPILPNIPFFYLCFRAWSHWKARSGSKHLRFLLEKDVAKLTPSYILQNAYALATSQSSLEKTQTDIVHTKDRTDERPPTDESQEQLILTKASGKIIAEQLDVPALEVEIERAIFQVEGAIKKARTTESKEETMHIVSPHKSER